MSFGSSIAYGVAIQAARRLLIMALVVLAIITCMLAAVAYFSYQWGVQQGEEELSKSTPFATAPLQPTGLRQTLRNQFLTNPKIHLPKIEGLHERNRHRNRGLTGTPAC